MSQPIELFIDEECSIGLDHRIHEGKFMWEMNFGSIDAAEDKTYLIYLKNMTPGDIEDLAVEITTADKEGVEASIVETLQSELQVGEVIPVEIKWSASPKVRAGTCRAGLEISCMLTAE